MSPASDPITVASTTNGIFADDFSSGTLGNWTSTARMRPSDGATGNAAPPSARCRLPASRRS